MAELNRNHWQLWDGLRDGPGGWFPTRIGSGFGREYALNRISSKKIVNLATFWLSFRICGLLATLCQKSHESRGISC